MLVLNSYGMCHKAERFRAMEPGMLSPHTDIKGLWLGGQVRCRHTEVLPARAILRAPL